MPITALALQKAFGTKSDWRVTAYQAGRDAEKMGDTPAKLCFASPRFKDPDCTFAQYSYPSGPVLNHQTVIETKVVAIAPKQKAVLFEAEFDGGGSGRAYRIGLWAYDGKSDRFFEELTFMISDQGIYKVYPDGPMAGYVLVADAVWTPGEAHFGRHRYDISLYKMSSDQSYERILEYITPQKFAGADDPPDVPIDIFAREMPRILRLLKDIYPAARR
ncbi:MAG: hypothetical protein HY243_03770 [Proteobacteria bacterium]|nr:hypothetical protein [Pseudomonadota bacterium]